MGLVNVTSVRTVDQFGAAASGTVSQINIPAGTYTSTVLSGTTALVEPSTINLIGFKNYSIVARGFTSARSSISSGLTIGATLLYHNL
ncbi:MAG: hypothetical protein IKD55_11930 [Sediminibacterium sp.]|nr:hypothetical protein [Sediminibacterium sp.]MCA6438389.1 hypothetical protein [Chitinophagaceae bacterium]MCA6448208.1 hypothetical protein [Chitinophagaceae bacterium]